MFYSITCNICFALNIDLFSFDFHFFYYYLSIYLFFFLSSFYRLIFSYSALSSAYWLIVFSFITLSSILLFAIRLLIVFISLSPLFSFFLFLSFFRVFFSIQPFRRYLPIFSCYFTSVSFTRLLYDCFLDYFSMLFHPTLPSLFHLLVSMLFSQ